MFEWFCKSEYGTTVIRRKLEPRNLGVVACAAADVFWKQSGKVFKKIVVEVEGKKFLCELFLDPLWDTEEIKSFILNIIVSAPP